MGSKKLRVLAVTVHPYYLNRDLYAIKLMSIYRTQSGIIVWRTNKILAAHTELSKLIPMAIEYGLNNNMPYINGLVQGECVLSPDRKTLQKHYGVSLSELIT